MTSFTKRSGTSFTLGPQASRVLGRNGRAMAEQGGFGALRNLFIEFSTDINRKMGAKRR